MKKYYAICAATIIVLCLFKVGENIIPTRADIEELQVAEIIGLDEAEDGNVTVTAILKKDTLDSESQEKKYNLVSVSASNYSKAVTLMRGVSDKYISLHHVKYYIIGEKTSKKTLENLVDYLARTDSVIATSNVFIAKNYDAKSFLEDVVENEGDIVSNLEEMLSDTNSLNYSADINILNIVETFLKKDIRGVIPYITAVEGDKKDMDVGIDQENSDGESIKSFGVKSLGVYKDMKVQYELTETQALGYNIINGKGNNLNLWVTDEEKNISADLNCNKEKYSLKFTMNSDKTKIEKIVINLKYIANIEEARTDEKLFKNDTLKVLQKVAEEKITSAIYDAYDKYLEIGIDFLNLEEKFKFNHPYLYIKYTDTIQDMLKEAILETNVVVNIEHTYDVMETNIYQKGE